MLTSWDIATRVMPIHEWYITPEDAKKGPSPMRTEGLDVHVNAAKRVRERLTRLVNNYPHPLLTATLRGQFAAVYQATGYGNTFINIDASPSRISPNAQSYSMHSGHMLASARVGRCFELWGIRVLSEKEAASQIALDGGLVPPNMESEYMPNENSKPIVKRPDLILPTQDGTGYIAVEVELTMHRKPSVYDTKLHAYSQNPACKGVIYVTREQSVLTRVQASAHRVLGDSWTNFLAVTQLRDGTVNAVNPRNKRLHHLISQCTGIEPDPALAPKPEQATTTPTRS